MKLRILDGLGDLAPEQWDALVGDHAPFLEWGWLASLEEAGCVGAETGWLPQHLTLWSEDRLVAACPFYLKSHSMGEFVFDQGWAEAAERAGIAYYPKLLAATPFTPATGARILCASEVDRGEVVRMLGEGMKTLCRANEFSSVHVNFCLPEEIELLCEVGFERRLGYQFQWKNDQGWTCFEDYLEALRSKRRNQVKRERRAIGESGVRIEILVGDDIRPEHVDAIHRLYRSTVDKFFWGKPYLNRRLFELLVERWSHRLCLVLAYCGEEIVAGAVNVLKGSVLYGRYWGCFTEIRYLHFEVCYYSAIEYCLQNGIERFEPGAGGEFKQMRGFDACPTVSAHFLTDRRFARAVADFLEREAKAVTEMIGIYGAHTAFRRTSAGGS